MSDPTLCRGMDSNGHQCICMRADDTYVDNDKRTLCTNCGHIASAHPQARPNVAAMVRGFQDAGKLRTAASISSSEKASREDAEAETSAGLRPKNSQKRKLDNAPEPASKKNKGSKAKGKAKKIEGEEVKYGKAVLLTCGLSTDGTLRNSKIPPVDDIQEMRQAGLVVLSNPKNPLSINTAWDNDDVQAEILRLFPDPLAYLSRHTPSGEQQSWVGAVARKGLLTIALDAHPTGVELADYCKILGRGPQERVLYIASKVSTRSWGNDTSRPLIRGKNAMYQ
ncbi:hypothetical protein C8F04DRAFT_1403868 [Mycena alexandri]|uniref:Uncharacterized protein n=1 Tax=Mycena alexandri TaxID=1745969 RepID=A0AAD6S2N4_9AGAR|nr:hypothetical protein C8F04DRAFT_1403868 [Mycena alexandri]